MIVATVKCERADCPLEREVAFSDMPGEPFTTVSRGVQEIFPDDLNQCRLKVGKACGYFERAIDAAINAGRFVRKSP